MSSTPRTMLNPPDHSAIQPEVIVKTTAVPLPGPSGTHMPAVVYAPTRLRWMGCKLLGRAWPSVYWSRLSNLSYRQVPVPQLPGPAWVRLKTRLGGICGTDTRLLLQRNHPATYIQNMTSSPMVLGHENVAVVDSVGDQVKNWAPGDRVCCEPAISCASRSIDPLCPPCSAGLFSLCEHVGGDENLPAAMMIGLNNFTGGSWGPWFVAHQSQLHRVPESMSDEQAVLVDPVACSLHGLLRRIPADDERVLIMGMGIIGLAIAACMRALGCRAHITAIVRHDYQEAWCRRCGVDETVSFPTGTSARQRHDTMARRLGGRRIAGRFGNHGFLGGYDVVYECIGSGESISESLKWTRARGTTVLMGTSNIHVVDTTPIWSKELTVLGGSGRQVEHFNGTDMHTYAAVFSLITSGKLNVDGMLTHTFAPADYKQALSTVTRRGRQAVIKAAFMHD